MDGEVVLVEAGFAGLTVARRLAEAGRQVVVDVLTRALGGRATSKEPSTRASASPPMCLRPSAADE